MSWREDTGGVFSMLPEGNQPGFCILRSEGVGCSGCLSVVKKALGFFKNDLCAVLGLSKDFGVAQNLPDDIDGTRSADLIAPARRSGTKEDAEGMSCRPVSQFSG